MTRWLLLRGLARETAHWGGFPDLLHERTGDEVLCMDLPGCGERRGERSPASVAAMACDVTSRLPRHDGPTVVLALSLGAMVAIEAARQAPGALAACVLVNTSAAGGARWHERLLPANHATVLRLAMPGLGALAREARVLAMTSARPRMHENLLPAWARIAGQRPVSAGNAARQLWAAARFRAASRPRIPLLLLASRGDTLVSPGCSRRLAADWSAPLREHPWAGHDLPLDDPQWVVDEAATWWAGIPR